MKGLKSLLLICLVFLITEAFSQHRYTIIIAGKKVGQVTADMQKKNGKTQMHILSEAKATVLWKRYDKTVEWDLEFDHNGKMTRSILVAHYNGDLEDSVLLALKNLTYTGFKFPKEKIHYPSPIYHVTSHLFFEEPVGIDSVYSERFHEFCKVESPEKGKYKLFLPEGTINNYEYDEEGLVEIFIDRPWFNLRIKRTDEELKKVSNK